MELDVEDEVASPVAHPKMMTRVASGSIKPNPKYVLAMAATTVVILRSPKFALGIVEWKSVMVKEFKVLQDNDTWVLVP